MFWVIVLSHAPLRHELLPRGGRGVCGLPDRNLRRGGDHHRPGLWPRDERRVRKVVIGFGSWLVVVCGVDERVYVGLSRTTPEQGKGWRI